MAYFEPTELDSRSRRPLQPNYIGYLSCITTISQTNSFVRHCRINPHEIIGKTLKRARRSSKHPSVTLEFTDDTVLQILVDGYDPVHRGIPKELDMDPFINAICTNASPVNLTVTGCTLITLSDKAYERRNRQDESDELRWDQRHCAVAFKFAGDDPTWHSVSAMMEECDPGTGSCIFRSYIDVYLKLHTNRPFRRKHKRRPRSRSQ